MHALEIVARNAGRTRRFRTAAIKHGVELGEQLLHLLVDADIDAAMEGHAFARHLFDAAVDIVLFHLEVGNAEAQQAAGAALALIDMHVMAGAAKLLGRRHAGGTRADDGDLLAGLLLRRIGTDITGLIGLVGQCLFNRLDRDRDVLEVQRAGFLAGRRADAAGEFRKIVGRVQVADRRVPVAIVDEIVPVRDLVVDRTARRAVAEGNAAIHAARGLLLDFRLRHRQREFAKMPDTIGCRLVLVHLPVDLEKTCYLAHVSVPVEHVAGLPPHPLSSSGRERNRGIGSLIGWVVMGAGKRLPPGRPIAYSAATLMRARSISCSARRYSTGMTFRNFGRKVAQLSRISLPRVEPV